MGNVITSGELPVYYSNGVCVTSKSSEFSLDFWMTEPGATEPSTICRVILSPYIAKKFMALMEDQIKVYEDAVGVIPIEGLKETKPGFVAPD